MKPCDVTLGARTRKKRRSDIPPKGCVQDQNSRLSGTRRKGGMALERPHIGPIPQRPSRSLNAKAV
jgi:hypothetical protein